MVRCACHPAGPNVERHPNGLLGEEIWMAGEGPEAFGVETAVEVRGGESARRWGFGGFLIGVFGGIEICK